jgi:hypothetical protein
MLASTTSALRTLVSRAGRAGVSRGMATAAMKWDDPLLLEDSLLAEDERLIMHNARSYCQVRRGRSGATACVCQASPCVVPVHPLLRCLARSPLFCHPFLVSHACFGAYIVRCPHHAIFVS